MAGRNIQAKLTSIGDASCSLPLLRKNKVATEHDPNLSVDELMDMCSRDPICMIDSLNLSKEVLRNVKAKGTALESIRSMRHILSHQLYVPLSQNLKIESLRGFFTDVIQVVDGLIADVQFRHTSESSAMYTRLHYLCLADTLDGYKSFRGRQNFLAKNKEDKERIKSSLESNLVVLADVLNACQTPTGSITPTHDLRIFHSVAIDLKLEEEPLSSTSSPPTTSAGYLPSSSGRPQELSSSGLIKKNAFFLLSLDGEEDTDSDSSRD